MKNTKLNMFGASKSVPENGGKVKTFNDLKREFEKAYASGKDHGAELMSLAQAVALSVIKVCADPQRKAAAEKDTVSDNGQNPAMFALRRGIVADMNLLDNTAKAANTATRTTLDKDGYPITEVVDKDAENALNTLIGETLSDGIDLVQEAAAAILEQAADHADGPEWLDLPYIVRRLSRRVYIRLDDSAAYKDIETVPTLEVYRAVRRAVQESRAVQTDPKNGYTYIEDMTPDGLDTILFRLGKYSGLAGYADNGRDVDTLPGAPAGYSRGDGQATADEHTARKCADIVARMGLTDRQAQVLKLRMQRKGYKAIATYLGVSDKAVKKTVLQIQKKANDIGFSPAGDN